MQTTSSDPVWNLKKKILFYILVLSLKFFSYRNTGVDLHLFKFCFTCTASVDSRKQLINLAPGIAIIKKPLFKKNRECNFFRPKTFTSMEYIKIKLNNIPMTNGH